MRALLLGLALALLGAQDLHAQGFGAPDTGARGGSGGGGGGIPSSARGVSSPSAVIDMTPVFAPAINDRYDANGSMYDSLFPTPDATSDFVAASGTLGVAPPCSSTQCEMALPGGDSLGGAGEQTLTLPAQFRYMLCRDSTAGAPGYDPCSGTGGPGTCTSTIGTTRTRSFPIVVYHAAANAYATYGIVSLSDGTCQGSGNFTVNVVPNLIVTGTTANDRVAPLYRDTIHYSTFGAKAIGEWIADATLESTHLPRSNLVSNGTMESDCSAGWSVASGTGTISQTTPTAAKLQDFHQRDSAWGNGCSLAHTSSGATFQSPAIATTAGKTYAVRYFARVGTFGAWHTMSSSVTNATALYDHTYNNAAAGWAATANGYLAGCQTIGFFRSEAWGVCIHKFRATSTSSRLVVGGLASGSILYVDEVYAWEPDLADTANMQPLFAGRVSATLDGDSQVGTGELGVGLAWALDRRRGSGLSIACPMSVCAGTYPGLGVSTLVDMTLDAGIFSAYGLQRYIAKQPALGLWQFGVNDIKGGGYGGGTAPASPDTAISNATLIGAMRTVGGYAGLPIWTTPQPWAYGSGSSTKCGGSWECGRMGNAIVSALLHSGLVGW